MSTAENAIYGIKKEKFDMFNKEEVNEMHKYLFEQITNHKKSDKEIVIMCIGTDRSTGDSLAPIVGTMIQDFCKENNIKLIGTLEYPCHAKNLHELYSAVDVENSLVIAIDASLGSIDNIGKAFVTNGSITPGAALNKDLGNVGDISIAGIVNVSGSFEFMILQNTRLHTVYSMAESISKAVIECISTLNKTNSFEEELEYVKAI
jgi:putative sporulation protein YyaC